MASGRTFSEASTSSLLNVEFHALDKAGIIRRSNLPWVHVPPASGAQNELPLASLESLPHRCIIAITVPGRYPLPNIAGNTVISKIDLVKAYHQIPIDKADVPKTVIATPFGLFEFLAIGSAP
jgi:hypothetical protein